jgi:hypothetical protein
VRPGPGFDLPNDTRQYNVNNYHVPSLKKNVSSTVSRREEGIFCVSCKQEHDFNDNKPFVVFITDQNFPPSHLADEHRCCVVLRLEDCLLSEQPGILKEFFGNRTGYLPEGSVLYFGSLSHLALRGLETYAEEVVKMFRVFSNMLSGGCSVAHTVHFPLGGIESDCIIRDMYDLDSWLRSGIVGVMLSLPASRELFWKIVREDNMTTTNQNCGERTLFLLVAIDNSQKICTVSGCISDGIPALMKPFPEQSEEQLVDTLMREIREKHAIEIDLEPNLDRCSGDNVFPDHANIECRIFAIGASHMTKMVGGLAECSINVINLAKPGWTLDEKTVLDLKNALKKAIRDRRTYLSSTHSRMQHFAVPTAPAILRIRKKSVTFGTLRANSMSGPRPISNCKCKNLHRY